MLDPFFLTAIKQDNDTSFTMLSWVSNGTKWKVSVTSMAFLSTLLSWLLYFFTPAGRRHIYCYHPSYDTIPLSPAVKRWALLTLKRKSWDCPGLDRCPCLDEPFVVDCKMIWQTCQRLLFLWRKGGCQDRIMQVYRWYLRNAARALDGPGKLVHAVWAQHWVSWGRKIVSSRPAWTNSKFKSAWAI